MIISSSHIRKLFRLALQTSIIAICLLGTSALYAQNDARVSGVVHSTKGEPLVAVNILLVNTTIGAVTNEKGEFTIRGLRPGSYDLQISMIGYRKKILNEVTASKHPKPIIIELEEEAFQLDQIEVTGERIFREQDDTRVSVQALQPREAKFLPGAGEDVIRSLQAFPGVLSPNDFTSQLVIRGSGPDQNLIIMDMVEVLNPYRLYGMISMFNPETVSDITLISGGFPAKYGDRLSAVLDVTYRDGKKDKALYGNFNASITNANIVLEGRSPFDIEGSWLFTARRTYYDLIFGPIASAAGLVDEDVAFPNFGDLQSKLIFTPWKGNKFFITGLASRDGVDVVSGADRKSPDSISVLNTSFNYLTSAGWHYTPDESMLNSFVVSYYRNFGDTEFDAKFLDPALNRDDFKGPQKDSLQALARLFGVAFNNSFDIRKISLKDEFVMKLDRHHVEMGAGWDFISADVTLELIIDDEIKEIIEATPRGSALLESSVQYQVYGKGYLYLQDKIEFGSKFFLQPGLRLDVYTHLEKSYLSPRLNASYALNPITTIRGAIGVYYQSPGYEKFFDQTQFFDFNEEYLRNLRAEKAYHYVLGLERWIDTKWIAKIDVYYKDFSDLIVQQKLLGTSYEVSSIPGSDPRSVNGWSDPFLIISDSLTNVPINDSYGEAYGFELMIEKKNIETGDKLSGWISYALAWAHRYRDGFKIPFTYDQRHTVNIVANYKINSWLEAGVFWRIGSNFPYTQPIGIRPRIVESETGPAIATDFNGDAILDVRWGDESTINQEKKPAYHRLDFRITAFDRFWNLDWAFYIDVINVYNNSNLNAYRFYVEEDGSLGRREIFMLPILPTLGINARF